MVVAALSWWDETPAFLTRLVRSLSGVCDRLVAYDGRWDLMPGSRDLSPAEQPAAIEAAAQAAGVLAEIHTAGAPFAWPSQVAKRDELMRRAGEVGDWILVVDGDELVQHAHPGKLRALLQATSLDVGEVTLRNLNRPWPYSLLAPARIRTRRLYRAGTTVSGPAHNDYQRGGLRLNGDPAHGGLAEAVDVTGAITVAHDNRARPRGRDVQAQEYRRARRRERVEAVL